jgi:hypothetical protein
MSDAVRYGQMRSEKVAEENEQCRQIVREINLQGGITQRQTLMLIYLLSMELENVEQMRALSKLVRELGGEELFLIGKPEEEQDGTQDA